MASGDLAYHRPRSLAEASALAARLGAGARFLAGGTEVVPDQRRGRGVATHLVSLRDLPELRGLREEAGALVIGAMCRHEEVAESSLVRAVFPVLAEACRHVGSAQIRRQGTIGGNSCGAVPCADTPPALIVGGAVFRIAGPAGPREMPAERFFLGPRRTALEPGEILLSILLPAQPAGSGAAFARFGLRRGMAVAVASVAARLTLSGGVVREARVALGAVAPVPLPARAAAAALAGRPPSEETFARAAEEAAAESRPISDLRGSEAWRREIVRVLALRAFREAARRASGGGA